MTRTSWPRHCLPVRPVSNRSDTSSLQAPGAFCDYVWVYLLCKYCKNGVLTYRTMKYALVLHVGLCYYFIYYTAQIQLCVSAPGTRRTIGKASDLQARRCRFYPRWTAKKFLWLRYAALCYHYCSNLLLQLPLLHPFNGLFSRTTWVSRYQKGKTSLDLNEARNDGVLGWQWHQLDNMQTVCTSLSRSRQITTATPHQFLTGQMLFLTPNQQCQNTECIL